MKRLSVPTAITGVIMLYGTGFCSNGTASPVDGAPVIQQAAGLLSNPWATAPLLFLGMMLVITELMSTHRRYLSGVAGTLCLGIVLVSHMLIGAPWLSIMLLIAGPVLLAVEAFILPGRVIGVAAGMICIFLGLHGMLGATAGMLYTLLVSALIMLMAFAAFLAYLSTNSTWRQLSSTVEISVGRTQVVNSTTDLADTHGTVAKQPDTQSDENQQTIGRRD